MRKVRWLRVVGVSLLVILAFLLIAYVIYQAASSNSTPPYIPMLVSIGSPEGGKYYNDYFDFPGPGAQQYVIGDQHSNIVNYTGVYSLAGTMQPAMEPMYDGGHAQANLIGNLVALSRTWPQTVLLEAGVGGTTVTQWVSGGFMARALSAVSSANALSNNASYVALWVWSGFVAEVANNTSPAFYLTQLMQLARGPFVIVSGPPEWVRGTTNAVALQNIQRALPNVVAGSAYVNMPLGYQDCNPSTGYFSASGMRMMALLAQTALARAVANTQTGTTPNHPTGAYAFGNTIFWTAPALSRVTGYAVVYLPYQDSCSDAAPPTPIVVPTNSLATSFLLPFASDGSIWQVDVCALNGVQTSSGSATSWVVINTGATVIHWLAYEGSYTDTFGTVWSGVFPLMYGNSVNYSQISISSTQNPDLYHVAAYATQGNVMSCIFPINPTFSYTVALFFAELIYFSVGLRKSQILVNGVECVTVDIYEQAGYANAWNFLCPGVIRGQLTINVSVVSVIGVGQLNSIEILPVNLHSNYSDDMYNDYNYY